MSDALEWRPVVGWETLYEVSNLGDVRTTGRGRERKYKPRVMKAHPGSSGYLQVGLSRPGAKGTTTMVHRIVANAFLGPKPEGYVTCHNDGDKLNNSASNLRYDTPSENSFDVLRMGRHGSQKSNLCKRGHRREGRNAVPSGGKPHVKSCRACSNAISYKRKHPEVDLQEESDKRYRAIMSDLGWKPLNHLSDDRKAQLELLMSDEVSINEIQRTTGIGWQTIRRHYPDYKPFERGGGGTAAVLRKAKEVMDNAQIGKGFRV